MVDVLERTDRAAPVRKLLVAVLTSPGDGVQDPGQREEREKGDGEQSSRRIFSTETAPSHRPWGIGVGCLMITGVLVDRLTTVDRLRLG